MHPGGVCGGSSMRTTAPGVREPRGFLLSSRSGRQGAWPQPCWMAPSTPQHHLLAGGEKRHTPAIASSDSRISNRIRWRVAGLVTTSLFKGGVAAPVGKTLQSPAGRSRSACGWSAVVPFARACSWVNVVLRLDLALDLTAFGRYPEPSALAM